MMRHLPIASRIVRNDLRLFWRTLTQQKLGLVGSVLIYGFLFLMMHLGAWALTHLFRSEPPLGFEVLFWLLLVFPMLGAAIHQSVTLLYERGDLDLLLTSPVPASIVLLTRLVSITAGVIVLVGLFALPPLDIAWMVFGPSYLAGYVVWLLLALLCSATGTMLTLMLARWLGARRARVLAQIIGVVAGSAAFIFFQLPNLLGRDSVDPRARLRLFQAMAHWVNRPLLNLPARAGRGEPWPLLELLLLTAGVVTLSVRRLQRAFVEGTQDATAETAPGRATKHGRTKSFQTGLFAATWRKDLRLIQRDPLLLTRGFKRNAFSCCPQFSCSRAKPAVLAPSQAEPLYCAACSPVFSPVSPPPGKRRLTCCDPARRSHGFFSPPRPPQEPPCPSPSPPSWPSDWLCCGIPGSLWPPWQRPR